eukprot:gene40194-48976_t
MSRFVLSQISSPLLRVYTKELKRFVGEASAKNAVGIDGVLKLRLEKSGVNSDFNGNEKGPIHSGGGDMHIIPLVRDMLQVLTQIIQEQEVKVGLESVTLAQQVRGQLLLLIRGSNFSLLELLKKANRSSVIPSQLLPSPFLSLCRASEVASVAMQFLTAPKVAGEEASTNAGVWDMLEAGLKEGLDLVKANQAHAPTHPWSKYTGRGGEAILNSLLFLVELKRGGVGACADAEQAVAVGAGKGVGLGGEKEVGWLRSSLTSLMDVGVWEKAKDMAAFYQALLRSRDKAGVGQAGNSIVAGVGVTAVGTGMTSLSLSPKKSRAEIFTFDAASSPPSSSSSTTSSAMRSKASFLSPRPPAHLQTPNAQGSSSSPTPLFSPVRSQQVGGEVSRFIGRVCDRVKGEGVLRLPPVHYALRILYSQTAVGAQTMQSGVGVLSSLLGLESVSVLNKENQEDEGKGWGEAWYLLSFDMGAHCQSLAHFKDASATTPSPLSMPSSILPPLCYHSVYAALEKTVKSGSGVGSDTYVLLPPGVCMEEIMAGLGVWTGEGPALRYMQLFPAYPTSITCMVHQPHVYVKGRGGDSEDEEEDEDKRGLASEILASRDLDELVDSRGIDTTAALSLSATASLVIRSDISRSLPSMCFHRSPRSFHVYLTATKTEGSSGYGMGRVTLVCGEEDIDIWEM